MQRYPFLRYATTVLRVLGWVVLVVGVFGSVVMGVRTGGFPGGFWAVGGAIFSFVAWVCLLATRELIYILIHTEENTRNTAEGLRRQSGQDKPVL